MEMEKAHYAVMFKPAYNELVTRVQSTQEQLREGPSTGSLATDGPIVVSITQGGFGQDVVDDERQVKERFLEYMFDCSGVDIPRSEEGFDQYFELRLIDEIVDLDDLL